jgi:hypothetical protein
MSGATVRTLEQAAAWVDEVGLALLFPKADVVLPSLWAEVNGSPERNWAVRDADGTFRQWTEEMGFLWGAKDELPAQGLVCVGKHLARVASCVAPRLLPMLVAANGDVAPDADPVAEAIREQGPLTGPQLRQATGLAKKRSTGASLRCTARSSSRARISSGRTVRGGHSPTTCSRASGAYRVGCLRANGLAGSWRSSFSSVPAN